MPLGKKLKSKYGVEGLTTRSLRGGLGEGAVCHRLGRTRHTQREHWARPAPRLAQATVPLCHQHGTLVYSPQNVGCGFGIEGRGGGKN